MDVQADLFLCLYMALAAGFLMSKLVWALHFSFEMLF